MHTIHTISIGKTLHQVFLTKSLLIVKPDFHLVMSKSKLAFLCENVLFTLFHSESNHPLFYFFTVCWPALDFALFPQPCTPFHAIHCICDYCASVCSGIYLLSLLVVCIHWLKCLICHLLWCTVLSAK